MSQELILEVKQKPDINFLQAKNRPIGDEQVNDYMLKDPATKQEYKVKLPYWVWFAIQRHYVIPGFSLSDYFWGAINGFKGDEKDDIKRAGFNLVAVANEMGMGKCLVGETLVLTVKGYRPIRALKVGDLVPGLGGIGTVLGTYRTSKSLLEIKTSGGRIFASPEHKFLTQFGWVETQFLNTSHKLLSILTSYDSTKSKVTPSPHREEGTQVLRVTRASEEERLYDISTSLRNYVAEGVIVHNSNLCMQLSGSIYGNEHAGEWEPDWDLVLKYTILARSRIIPLWKEGKEKGRIMLTLLDDLDSIFSKELWFEDRPLYIKLRKAINLMRPRLSNMLVSAPSLNDVISILNSKITFEVMPFPDQTYMVERYCRFVDQFSSTSNFFRKIMTEFSKFRLKNLPSDVYQQYDAMRAEKEEDEMTALEEAMEAAEEKKNAKSSFNEKKDENAPPTRNLAKCTVCGYEWWTFAKPRQCNRCQGAIILTQYA